MNSETNTQPEVYYPENYQGRHEPAERYALIIVSLLAAASRLWVLLARPFNTAEANLALQTGESWDTIIRLITLGAEKHTPYSVKYSLLLKLWASIGGQSEVWLRIPSLIFGAAGLYFAYLLARRVGGRKTTVIAFALTALCPYHIMFSGLVGFESLLFFLCTAAAYFFSRIFFGEDGMVPPALFLLAMLPAMALHYIGAFLLPAFLLLFFFRISRRNNLISWVVALLPAICLAVFLTPEWRQIFSNEWSPKASLLMFMTPNLTSPLLWFCVIFFEAYFKVFMTLIHMYTGSMMNGPTFFGAISGFITFQLAFMLGFREYIDGIKPRVFLFFALGSAIVLAAASSFAAIPLNIGMLPAYALFNVVVAGGIVRFANRILKCIFGAAVVLIFWGGLVSINTNYEKLPDWKKIAGATAAINRNGAPTIVINGWDSAAFTYYARGRYPVQAIFPEFSPFFSSGETRFQEEIVRPFNGRFDTATDLVIQTIRENGEAIVVLDRKKLYKDIKVQTEFERLLGLSKNGVLSLEIHEFTPDDRIVPLNKIYGQAPDPRVPLQNIYVIRVRHFGGAFNLPD